MDEPFSALDVLTAENLRTELMALWAQPDFPTKAICIVTHNIEEAVLLADRVLVLGTNPGQIKAEVAVHLPRPRDRRSPTSTSPSTSCTPPHRQRRTARAQPPRPAAAQPADSPAAGRAVGGLAGLVEIVYAHNGQTDLADLADELSFEVDDLLPLVDAAIMLGLLDLEGARGVPHRDRPRLVHRRHPNQQGDLRPPRGRPRPPRAHHRQGPGEQRRRHPARRLLPRPAPSRFTAEYTERQLDIAIDWGRYGELFDFDADTRELVLSEVATALTRHLLE